MKNKGLIIVLTIFVTLLCLYYLSFTYVSRGVQQDAISNATDVNGVVNLGKKQRYLDSVCSPQVLTSISLVVEN